MDIPIVGLEPSEILTLRDEYVDLCDDESVQLAEKIAAKSFLFEEFLYTELAAGNIQKIGNHRKIYIHDHCHTKALVGSYSAVEKIGRASCRERVRSTGDDGSIEVKGRSIRR